MPESQRLKQQHQVLARLTALINYHQDNLGAAETKGERTEEEEEEEMGAIEGKPRYLLEINVDWEIPTNTDWRHFNAKVIYELKRVESLNFPQ